MVFIRKSFGFFIYAFLVICISFASSNSASANLLSQCIASTNLEEHCYPRSYPKVKSELVLRVPNERVGDISSSRAREIIEEAAAEWSAALGINISVDDEANGFDPEVDSGSISLGDYYNKHILPRRERDRTALHSQALGYSPIIPLNSRFNNIRRPADTSDTLGIARPRIIVGSEIQESYMVINGDNFTSSLSFGTGVQLESKFKRFILHEIGHMIGLGHIFTLDDTFFREPSQLPILPADTDFPIMHPINNFSSEELTRADISMARHLYPENNFFGNLFSETGTITGKAETQEGNPLLGVYITALNINSLEKSASTFVDIQNQGLSDFSLAGLEPGTYVLRVDRLKARGRERTPTPVEPYRFHSSENLTQGYIDNLGSISNVSYDEAANNQSMLFTVSAGTSTEVNFKDIFVSDDNPNNFNELINEDFKLIFSNGAPVGNAPTGRIETSGDQDFFKLTIPEIGTVNFNVRCRFNCHFALYRDDKTLITSRDGIAGREFNVSEAVFDGLYYVEIRGRTTLDTGSYRIRTGEFNQSQEGDFCSQLKLTQGISSSNITCPNNPEPPNPPAGEVALRVDQDGLNVNFISITNNVTIQGITWRFGDGSGSNQENPSHSYSEPGQYLVELEVLDSNTNRTLSSSALITVDRNIEIIDVVPITTNPSQFSEFEMRIIGNGLPLDNDANPNLGVFISNCLDYSTVSRSLTEHIVKCTFIGSGTQDGLVKRRPGSRETLHEFQVEVAGVDLEAVAIPLTLNRNLRDSAEGRLIPDFFSFTADEVARYTVQVRTGGSNRLRVDLMDESGEVIRSLEGSKPNLTFSNLTANTNYFIQVSSVRDDDRSFNYRIRVRRSGAARADDNTDFKFIGSIRLFNVAVKVRSGREVRRATRIRSQITEDLPIEIINNSNGLIRFEPSEFTIEGSARRRFQTIRVFFASREEFINNLDNLTITRENNRNIALFSTIFRDIRGGSEIEKIIKVDLGNIEDLNPDPGANPNPGTPPVIGIPQVISNNALITTGIDTDSGIVVWGEIDRPDPDNGTFTIRAFDINSESSRIIHERQLVPLNNNSLLTTVSTDTIKISGNKVLWNENMLEPDENRGSSLVTARTLVKDLVDDSLITIPNSIGARISGNKVIYKKFDDQVLNLAVFDLGTQTETIIDSNDLGNITSTSTAINIDGDTIVFIGRFFMDDDDGSTVSRQSIFTYNLNTRTLSDPLFGLNPLGFVENIVIDGENIALIESVFFPSVGNNGAHIRSARITNASTGLVTELLIDNGTTRLLSGIDLDQDLVVVSVNLNNNEAGLEGEATLFNLSTGSDTNIIEENIFGNFRSSIGLNQNILGFINSDNQASVLIIENNN